MMRVEPREEDPNVNIVLRCGMTVGEDKGKQPREGVWVYKALEKEVGFDLECAKETFMEVKKRFTEASTLGSQDKQSEEMDPSINVLVILLRDYAWSTKLVSIRQEQGMR